MDERYAEKIRRVEHYLCEKCEHEKCGTSICPIESLSDEEILRIYNRELGKGDG